VGDGLGMRLTITSIQFKYYMYTCEQSCLVCKYRVERTATVKATEFVFLTFEEVDWETA